MPGIVDKRQDPEALGVLLRHYMHAGEDHDAVPRLTKYESCSDFGMLMVPAEKTMTAGTFLSGRDRAEVDEEGGLMEEPSTTEDGHHKGARVGRVGGLPRLRVALAVVLVMATVLGFGLVVDVRGEWTLMPNGVADQRRDAMPHLDDVLSDAERSRPSSSDKEEAGQQAWWNGGRGPGEPDPERRDEEDADESSAWRWRRQHARTAYLRNAV